MRWKKSYVKSHHERMKKKFNQRKVGKQNCPYVVLIAYRLKCIKIYYVELKGDGLVLGDLTL